MNPTFSIIIPVYDVAPYLRECLDSVLAQTFTNWEAICVDDGSTDGSSTILDEYAAKDGRFHMIHQTNAGVSAARNAALDLATGDWVCFLDADDLFQPWILQHVKGALDVEPHADVVAFKTICFDTSSEVMWNVPPSGKIVQVVDSRHDVDVRNARRMFFEKAYRRSLIGGTRFRPYILGEDLLFELEVMMHSDQTVMLDSTGYCYRQRMGSVTHTCMTVRKLKDMMHYQLDRLNCIVTCPKHVGASYIRGILNGLFEKIPFMMVGLSDDEMREVFKEWKTVLSEAEETGCVRGFQEVRYRAFKVLPSCVMAKVLFVFPHWLKSKGFHR